MRSSAMRSAFPGRHAARKPVLRLAGALLLAALFFTAAAPAAEPPDVVVSIKPVHSLVAKLMKGVAEPVLIVGGTATPYGYELAAKQKRQIAEADLIIHVGEELEPFLAKPLAGIEDERVMELLASRELKI
ncbi:MAG: metal ABC transporter solute-binding protein, Zn/Mn family, partial [Pseudomonadota bacterium]